MFDAYCYLYCLSSMEWSIHKLDTIQDMMTLLGISKREDLCQIDISKYKKVYCDMSVESMSNGVSCWVYREDDSSEKSFVCGDKVLFVLCDDVKPIDIHNTSVDEFIKFTTL